MSAIFKIFLKNVVLQMGKSSKTPLVTLILQVLQSKLQILFIVY